MSEIVEKIARAMAEEDNYDRGDAIYRKRAEIALRLAAEHFAEMAEKRAQQMTEAANAEGDTQRQAINRCGAVSFTFFAHSIRTSVEG